MNYPEEHPLRGCSDAHIGDMAKAAMRAIDEHTPTMSAVYSTADLLALVHEFKQLKAEHDASSRRREDASELYGRRKDVAHCSRASEDLGWVELLEHVDGVWVSRRGAIQERDALKASAPPSDWLTRAIATAGAPEGTDWAGLLEHVGRQGQDNNELKSSVKLMETLATDIDAEIPGPANWWGENGTVIRARKLRERAEAAESGRDKLKADKDKAISKARDLVNIYPVTMVEAVDDLVGLLNVYLKSDSESRERAGRAERRAEELDAVEESAYGMNMELCAVLEMVPSEGGDGSLFGPEPGDGVAKFVRKKLDDDAAHIKELTADRSKALAIVHDRANIYPSTMVGAVDGLVKLWAIYVKSDSEARERAESAEMALETKSDELGAMLSNAKQEVKVSRHRIKELESELETSNGYRTGISNDLDQTQLQSNEFSRELNDVAGLLDERPARGVLVGPGIEDGVAFVVSKRLRKDAARIAELEVKLKSETVEREKWQYLAHCVGLEVGGTGLDMFCETNGIVAKARNLSLRAVRAETELKNTTPTQSDLSRIAADVSRIVASLERIESCPKS